MSVADLPERRGTAWAGRVVVSVMHACIVSQGGQHNSAQSHYSLVEPVPNHFAGPDTAELDALTAPALLAVENGPCRPANLAFAGQSNDTYYSRGAHTRRILSAYTFSLSSKSIHASTLRGNTSDVRVCVIVPRRIQRAGQAFKVDGRKSLAVLWPGLLDAGDVQFHDDEPGGLNFVQYWSGEVIGQIVLCDGAPCQY